MKFKLIVILFIFIFLVNSYGTTKAAEINYLVKAGDTLYKISREYGITINSLRVVNNLWTDIIYVGQILIIPVDKINYRVKAGDSLYLISRRYNTTVQEIKNLNQLSSDLILVGQTLLIPGSTELYTINGKVEIFNKTWGSLQSQGKEESPNTVLPIRISNYAPEYQEGEIIVKYKPLITSQDTANLEEENDLIEINNLETDTGKIVHYQIPAGEKIEDLVQRYSEEEGVSWVEPNYIFYPTAIPSDKYYNQYQWDFINLNLEAAWDLQKGKKTVTVAVLDTGVIPEHPDLKGNLLSGVDFVGGNNTYSIKNYQITDSDPTDETPLAEGGSHGTHVAGTIGALTNNTTGIAGINWNIKLLPVRVLSRKGGTSWDLTEGIYYAIDQGVDIINMSLGSNHRSNLQEEAIKEAYNRGITIIAATGNEGSQVYYPAAFPETIAVGAVDRENRKTYYSNFGSEVDLVAPGGNYGEPIYSTWGYFEQGKTYSGYKGMVGTSMATPHVSGVAALLIASGVTGPENIRNRLTTTAIDLGDPGKDNYYGYGLVDAYGALLGKKLKPPVVFAAKLEGDKVLVESEIINAASDGTFTLQKVKTADVYLIGWRDVNENQLIDTGDYFGKTEYPVNLQKFDTIPVIQLYYLSPTNDYPLYRVLN